VSGALQVTISATEVDGPSQNEIRELRFGTLANARVTLAGQTITSGQVVTLPVRTARTTFSVQRATAGVSTTVPLSVVDACGTWPTFVGGGTGAGF